MSASKWLGVVVLAIGLAASTAGRCVAGGAVSHTRYLYDGFGNVRAAAVVIRTDHSAWPFAVPGAFLDLPVTVQVASTPQGQGHRTVLAQVVADALGLKPSDVRATADIDTAKDGWSIASGNYSSRFAPAVAGAARIAAASGRCRTTSCPSCSKKSKPARKRPSLPASSASAGRRFTNPCAVLLAPTTKRSPLPPISPPRRRNPHDERIFCFAGSPRPGAGPVPKL